MEVTSAFPLYFPSFTAADTRRRSFHEPSLLRSPWAHDIRIDASRRHEIGIGGPIARPSSEPSHSPDESGVPEPSTPTLRHPDTSPPLHSAVLSFLDHDARPEPSATPSPVDHAEASPTHPLRRPPSVRSLSTITVAPSTVALATVTIPHAVTMDDWGTSHGYDEESRGRRGSWSVACDWLREVPVDTLSDNLYTVRFVRQQFVPYVRKTTLYEHGIPEPSYPPAPEVPLDVAALYLPRTRSMDALYLRCSSERWSMWVLMMVSGFEEDRDGGANSVASCTGGGSALQDLGTG